MSNFMPLTTSDLFICSIHIVIKEQISLSLLCDSGLHSLELKGDMNFQISDPASTHLKITLSQSPADVFGTMLQFKQHTNIAKFTPGVGPKVVALKDPGRAFPISLAVPRHLAFCQYFTLPGLFHMESMEWGVDSTWIPWNVKWIPCVWVMDSMKYQMDSITFPGWSPYGIHVELVHGIIILYLFYTISIPFSE